MGQHSMRGPRELIGSPQPSIIFFFAVYLVSLGRVIENVAPPEDLLMEIVYSRYHDRHATTLQLPGCPIPCFEIPARAEAIARAIQEA